MAPRRIFAACAGSPKLSASTMALIRPSRNGDDSPAGSGGPSRKNRVQLPAGSIKLNPDTPPTFLRGRGRVIRGWPETGSLKRAKDLAEPGVVRGG